MPTQVKKRAVRRQRDPRAPAKARLAAFLSALLVLCLLLGYMYICANTVHIRRATVWFPDLPEEFDNTTILFCTDFDLHGTNTPGKAIALMDRLRALEPDLLLLGGDYASGSLSERWTRARDDERLSALSLRRGALLSSLNAFEAPLGKFAVCGGHDEDPDMLRISMRQGGVELLSDSGVVLKRGEAALGVAGLANGTGEPRNVEAVSRLVRPEDFVIVLAHDPTDAVSIQTSESAGGGAWADLILCGGTHGGQIVVGGQTPLRLNEFQRRYRAGWRREGDQVLLTSAGVGCEGLNLRLNTEAEVHFITLRRGSPPGTGFTPANPDAHWNQ